MIREVAGYNFDAYIWVLYVLVFISLYPYILSTRALNMVLYSAVRRRGVQAHVRVARGRERRGPHLARHQQRGRHDVTYQPGM